MFQGLSPFFTIVYYNQESRVICGPWGLYCTPCCTDNFLSTTMYRRCVVIINIYVVGVHRALHNVYFSCI